MNIHEAKLKVSKKYLSENCVNIAIGIRIKNNKSDIVLNVLKLDPNIPKDFDGWKIVQKIVQKKEDLTSKSKKKTL